MIHCTKLVIRNFKSIVDHCSLVDTKVLKILVLFIKRTTHICNKFTNNSLIFNFLMLNFGSQEPV